MGADFSSGMVARAESARRQAGIVNCRFVVAEAGALPFLEAGFDSVRSTASLKFWPDPVGGLCEIHRVLAPGGKALLIEADREISPEEIPPFLGELGLSDLARPVGAFLLLRFVRRVGVTREEAAQMAQRSRFGGGKVEPIPRSPFFCMELVRQV